MANLHAAIGVCQIQKINEIRKTRQEVCKIYHSTLSPLDWLHAPQGDFENINPFLYYIRVIKGSRSKFRKHMLDNGVDTGIHWQAGHNFTFFKDCRKGCLKVTDKIVKEIVSLPLHSKMKISDREQIVRFVKSFNG
jgi:dTDP-4-amino-4,6-dideoxygalactose transaminase